MHTACWIPNATNTHYRNMYSLLLFHCNNGCTNAPQCYVIRALPVFFTFTGMDLYVYQRVNVQSKRTSTNMHAPNANCSRVHTHIYTSVNTYIHTYIHAYMHTHTYMHTYTYINTYIYKYINAGIHTHTYIQHIHKYIHKYTKNTYMHTYIRTHTCTRAFLTLKNRDTASWESFRLQSVEIKSFS